MPKYLSLFFLVIGSACLWSQAEVLFRPLEAKGKIPADFTSYTIEKIKAEEHNHSEEFLALSKKHQKHFLKSVHQGIDDILRSGTVLFGDTLTAYVSAVGRKILGNDPSLEHIRFYTLKSNVVNAFSTNQGIIFVSQGLLAQVKNEAQLAFVLAHELAHYTQRHVIVGFKENMDLMTSRKSMSEKIKRYSIYSKDKEYEADRIGVEFYNKAGYSLNDLYSVFDLLTFSYLPFESKVVNPSYFNTPMFYLPPSFFKKDLPKVSPDENADDSRSTHPNIKSRRDQLKGEIPKYKSWEENSTRTSVEAFEYARSLARMEQIRNDLYDFDYISALYNVYLLEDALGTNLYFNQYKAQTWLGLLIFKTYSRFSDITANLTKIQGEQHQMHHVIRALNRRQLATLALRNIYDIRKQFPDDALIHGVYEMAVATLVKDEKFRLKDFYSISYQELMSRYGNQSNAVENADQATQLSSLELAQQRAKFGMNNDGKIDDDDFFKYGLSDIIQDEEFVKLFERAQRQHKLKNPIPEVKNTSDSSSKPKNQKSQKTPPAAKTERQEDKMRVGIDRLILFEPRGLALRNGRFDVVEAEHLEIKIKNAFEKLDIDFMQVMKVGSKELKDADALMYNEKAVLMNTLTQLMEYRELQLFPVDYEAIQNLRKKYNTDKVGFIVLEYKNSSWAYKAAAVSLLTTIPGLALAAHNSAERFSMSLILYDLKSYSIDGVMRYNVNGRPSAAAIEALSYNMLSILNSTKKVKADA